MLTLFCRTIHILSSATLLLFIHISLAGCQRLAWLNTHGEGLSLYRRTKPPTYLEKNRTTVIRFLKQTFKKESISVKQTVTPKEDFWNEINKNFHLLHHIDKPAVKAQIAWFVESTTYLNHTICSAAPYIHFVYEQVKKRHLPAELVLLPLVESTYNPLAINRVSGASGLWQLTANTARGFGVRQDWLFDGRHDIYASTHAALDYLTYLNQFFSGNWLLTLAAYDTGEGNVQSAIRSNARRNLSISFWNLPLALETRSYVPRLLALSAIIKNPDQYGIKLPDISKYSYLEHVEIQAGISMIHAAELANISIKDLKRFNPGFKKIIFMPNKPYRLLLPKHCIIALKKKLEKLPKKTLYSKLFYHTIQPGDTLSRIAKYYKVTVKNLCLWNGLESKTILSVNKKLIVKDPLSGYDKLQNAFLADISDDLHCYTVRKGDNLYTIARQFDIKQQDLVKWNHLKSSIIKPGQRLKIQFITSKQ